jgi:hypothetical protein
MTIAKTKSKKVTKTNRKTKTKRASKQSSLFNKKSTDLRGKNILNMKKDDIITCDKKTNESLFEAYHSVFSYMTSSPEIYAYLANLCGSNFIQINKNDDIRTLTENNTIFCKSEEETHYKFYNASTKKIYDPYEHYQLYNTHGNCFMYALYLSSKYSNSNIMDDNSFKYKLIDIEKYTVKKKYGKKSYYIVVNEQNEIKKLAYKVFVWNDWVIMNKMIRFLEKHGNSLYDIYVNEWNDIVQDESISNHYGINREKSFDEYFANFKYLVSNMNFTYIMTWEQVENWDLQRDRYRNYENSGIEGATTIIYKNDYMFTEEEKEKVFL